MEMKFALILSAIKDVVGLVTSDTVREFIAGTYSNGEIRSMSDMVHGEFLSPSEKKRILYGDRGSKSKKKKKKNKNVKFQL